MTMLDRMRQHKSWLKWSLGIVVLTFVLLYVPSFLRDTTAGAAPSDVVATVDGRKVTAGTFQQIYTQQVAQMRSAYGEVNDDMLRQLGVGERLVQQLVEQEAELAEADRLGITVSDGELSERLQASPMFQENGHFVGYTRYSQMLADARPPVKPADFEEDLRRSLAAEKLQAIVTGWIRVSDAEVAQEYRKRNEKVKADLAVFTADKFKSAVTPTDAEIAAAFNAHPDTYKIPEKRRVRFFAIDAQSLRSKMTVTPQEIQDRYTQNASTYSTPEQIRASHILFKTDGKDDAAVRKVAESVLAKVKAGGDFAALARQYSDDDNSKASGGDLDFFGRGTMVKEFDDVAFAMQPGQVSDLVKTQFGYHIIKLTDRKPAATKTLDDVRSQIEDQIGFEKAQAEASKIAESISAEIKTPADMDKVAKERGLTILDSGLFARDEAIAGLGYAPGVAAQAFSMNQDKVAGPVVTNQGYAFVNLVEVKPSYVPKLDEVKDKVKDDVARQQAVLIAKDKAAAMAQAAAHSNFAAAAKAAGVDVKNTGAIARGAALPEVGVSDAVDKVLFSLKPGETSAAIALDNAVVVAHVDEHDDVTPAALDAERETLRSELQQQRASAFFAAYMAKAREKMKIVYNDATIKTLIGG